MRRLPLWFAILLFLCAPVTAAPPGKPAPFALTDGDRIVLIGDDLIERDQKSGYLETLLTLLNPGKSLTFRNLGWSGDTVFGDARAGFGGRADGLRHLKEHVLALKPTVIVVGYGMSESFDGEPGLSSFEAGYNALLDTLAPTKARIVLLSPIAHEDLGRPLPDPAEHNRRLALYRNVISRIASTREGHYLDLSQSKDRLGAAVRPSPGTNGNLTDDGIHLTETGYWLVGSRVALDLTDEPYPAWHVRVGTDGKTETNRTNLSHVRATPRGVRFEALDVSLPPPPPPSTSFTTPPRILEVDGLAPGRYTLKIDGKSIVTATDADWKRMELRQGPEFDRVEQLRATINEKNRLYFYRWRPQNETYLFGFRKHEQGNNAREIPLFDPLVAAREQEIARLRVPVSHVYEIVPESEAGR